LRYVALLAALTLALFASACGGRADEPTSQDQPPSLAEEAQQVAADEANDDSMSSGSVDADNSADADDSSDASDATGSSDDVADGSVEASAKPTVRAQLEATAPDTVVLASGSPQLIEFFAYW
jgi:cell pole-organizing protein PopZ